VGLRSRRSSSSRSAIRSQCRDPLAHGIVSKGSASNGRAAPWGLRSRRSSSSRSAIRSQCRDPWVHGIVSKGSASNGRVTPRGCVAGAVPRAVRRSVLHAAIRWLTESCQRDRRQTAELLRGICVASAVLARSAIRSQCPIRGFINRVKGIGVKRQSYSAGLRSRCSSSSRSAIRFSMPRSVG